MLQAPGRQIAVKSCHFQGWSHVHVPAQTQTDRQTDTHTHTPGNVIMSYLRGSLTALYTSLTSWDCPD